MIRTYTLDCHAANPQMPLEPVCPYTGSAATFVLINLPRPHGKQRIDAVTLSITNADAAISAHPATREGSSWIVTVPAAAIGPAGNVKDGIIISASGVDEQNRPVPSWIIGAANLRVKNQDGTAVPGEPRVLISWYDARPENPRGVFICPNPDGQAMLDLYDGHNYRPLVGGGTDVTGKLPVKPLPKYLHALSFDDTYPADAEAWYESLAPDAMGGACSAVRRGGFLYRNYDWTFDSAAEFIVRMSAAEGRHASVGVASLGASLTEDEVANGVYTAKYRALPGMTLDGINDAGVVAEINVDGGPKTGWHGTGANALHILAAVRWVLDHGETAAQAAEYIAANVKQPTGDLNFHFMIADGTDTYIVENGESHLIDAADAKVLTNYALYDEAHAGGGKERYQLLAGGAAIEAAQWTNAYAEGNDWDSDFGSAAAHASAITQWAEQGETKEAHRGKTTAGGSPWWQTVHTSVYDFENKTLKVAVQESDEYFTFAVDHANVDLAPIEAQLASLESQLAGKVDAVTGKGLSSNDYTDADKAEVAKVKDKADEFTEWDIESHSGGFAPAGQPEWIGNEWRLKVVDIHGETGFISDQESGKDALSLNFGYGIVTATRKRVLRTGDAPVTSDIIDPALAAAVGKIADAKLTRDFVNTMVSTNSAHYLTARAGTAGAYTYPPFASASALRAALAAHTEQTPQFFYAGEAFTPTKNDWVIVSEDEDHPLGTITPASRYGFVGTFGSGGSFQYQVSYKLPLTTEQIAALDSGITSVLVTWLTTFKGTDTATTLAAVLAKLAHLESDGTADDTFATDLLGKQVAITAIDARIKTNAESAAEPTNAVTLNDNAPKTVTVATVESPATPSLAVTFGTARNGGLRICELYILNGTADTDLTFDSAVHFVSTGDSFPACEAGINYFVFAEVAANLWKVTRETLKSITTPTPVAAA